VTEPNDADRTARLLAAGAEGLGDDWADTGQAWGEGRRVDFAVEGLPSADGRYVAPGALRFPDAPVPVTARTFGADDPRGVALGIVGKAEAFERREGGLVSALVTLREGADPALLGMNTHMEVDDVTYGESGVDRLTFGSARVRGLFLSPGPSAWPDLDVAPAGPCHPYDEACGGPGGPCRNHGGRVAGPDVVVPATALHGPVRLPVTAEPDAVPAWVRDAWEKAAGSEPDTTDPADGLRSRVVPNRDGDTEVRAWRPGDGDLRCQRCGHPNVVWYADNETWNQVMPDDGVLCILCFIAKAETIHGVQAWGVFRDSPPFVGEFARGLEAGQSMRPAARQRPTQQTSAERVVEAVERLHRPVPDPEGRPGVVWCSCAGGERDRPYYEYDDCPTRAALAAAREADTRGGVDA